MHTYVFDVEIEQETDGRWSAVIPTLPGCATWGYSKQEAFQSLQEAAKAYLEVLLEEGQRTAARSSQECDGVAGKRYCCHGMTHQKNLGKRS